MQQCNDHITSQLLVLLALMLHDRDSLFVISEFTHFVGIGLLGYKLYLKKSVVGEHGVGWGDCGWRKLSCRARCPSSCVLPGTGHDFLMFILYSVY